MFAQARGGKKQRGVSLSGLPWSACSGSSSRNLTSLHGQWENKGGFTMRASVSQSVGGQRLGHRRRRRSKPLTFSPGFIAGDTRVVCSAQPQSLLRHPWLCKSVHSPHSPSASKMPVFISRAATRGPLLLSPRLDSSHKTAIKLTGQQHSPGPSITKKPLSASVLLQQIFQF